MTHLALIGPAWFQRLLGVPAAAAPQAQQAHVLFAFRYGALAACLILLAALGWFGWLYWREGRRPGWNVKGLLLFLRIVALASLLLMLAQPTLRVNQVSQVPPNVLIFVDTSQSMARQDPRLPAARAALEAKAAGLSLQQDRASPRIARADAMLNAAGILRSLAGHYTIHLYQFASQPRAVPLPANAASLKSYRIALAPDARNGQSTGIGDALQAGLGQVSGQPVAGALLVSDGGSNTGEDPLSAADQARRLGLAISTVGIGDPTPTRDVAVISVLADDVVRVHNTVTAYADLMQRGYAGKTIRVELDRNGVPFQTQHVRLAPDNQKQEVRFTYVPTQPGHYVYTVKAAVQPGEVTADNNQGSFSQDVIKKKLRILMVENEPRYEFRYLKNAILRDTSLQFACILLSGDDATTGGEGNIPVHGFPTDEKSLFSYDILILGDVPRATFSDAQLLAIRRFVEDRGASLLAIAGEDHMPFEYYGTALQPVLPVVFGPTPDPILTDQEFQWKLTAAGQNSPVMQLEDDPALNTQVWDTLPGMYWCAGTDRPRPGATVLAVNPIRSNANGPYTLAAYQTFGAGKCYMDLVDSTWRWRWRVGDRYFYRYWGQVLRFLTPRELPGNSRFVQLTLDRKKLDLGGRVTLSARLLDAYYHPVKAQHVEATLTGPGGIRQTLELQSTPNSPGLYSSEYEPPRVGSYNFTVQSPAAASAKASAGLLVEALELEKQKPELDERLLKQIAAASGGVYYEPDQLQLWLRSLPHNALTVHSNQEYPLWDAPILLAAFIIPIGLEWLIRKRSGLL